MPLAELADGGNTTYQHRNGVVCKLINDEFVPVTPGNNTLHSVILRQYHALALGGHIGEKKLLATAKKRFYWPGLAKDIEHFCHECPVCQANNHSS